MKLLKIRVPNYKKIRDTDWISCRDMTVFVGKNEAGKTGQHKGAMCQTRRIRTASLQDASESSGASESALAFWRMRRSCRFGPRDTGKSEAPHQRVAFVLLARCSGEAGVMHQTDSIPIP